MTDTEDNSRRESPSFLLSQIDLRDPLEELEQTYARRRATYENLAESRNSELLDDAFELVRQQLEAIRSSTAASSTATSSAEDPAHETPSPSDPNHDHDTPA